jgi:hypothetical protein
MEYKEKYLKYKKKYLKLKGGAELPDPELPVPELTVPELRSPTLTPASLPAQDYKARDPWDREKDYYLEYRAFSMATIDKIDFIITNYLTRLDRIGKHNFKMDSNDLRNILLQKYADKLGEDRLNDPTPLQHPTNVSQATQITEDVFLCLTLTAHYFEYLPAIKPDYIISKENIIAAEGNINFTTQKNKSLRIESILELVIGFFEEPNINLQINYLIEKIKIFKSINEFNYQPEELYKRVLHEKYYRLYLMIKLAEYLTTYLNSILQVFNFLQNDLKKVDTFIKNFKKKINKYIEFLEEENRFDEINRVISLLENILPKLNDFYRLLDIFSFHEELYTLNYETLGCQILLDHYNKKKYSKITPNELPFEDTFLVDVDDDCNIKKFKPKEPNSTANLKSIENELSALENLIKKLKLNEKKRNQPQKPLQQMSRRDPKFTQLQQITDQMLSMNFKTESRKDYQRKELLKSLTVEKRKLAAQKAKEYQLKAKIAEDSKKDYIFGDQSNFTSSGYNFKIKSIKNAVGASNNSLIIELEDNFHFNAIWKGGKFDTFHFTDESDPKLKIRYYFDNIGRVTKFYRRIGDAKLEPEPITEENNLGLFSQLMGYMITIINALLEIKSEFKDQVGFPTFLGDNIFK